MKKSSAKRSADQSKKNGKRAWLPVLCRVSGIMLLLVVIALCLPITLPRVFGFEIYEVVSGSMEPEIPVGSVLYVKAVDPTEIVDGEVIAYQDADGVVAHRVVHNRTTMGEMVTKGDANNTEDRKPIPYTAIVGRVETHLPFAGMVMSLYASVVGKIYLLLTAACGVMLCMLAERLG